MNWDYRYTCIRDATLTLSVVLNAGYRHEAIEWRNWLLRALAGDAEKMRILYRFDGSRRLEEWKPDWLPGFRWTQPIRVGNSAAGQLQLDIYGELMSTLRLASQHRIKPSSEELKVIENA